ncbi:MAG: tRNA(Ile)(2)-agmatinylcytidine synthase [Candidatus Bathyarchaeia archaeon]
MQLHIGLDDTDSTSGGCTTYLAARIVEKLTKLQIKYNDYPNIIRLNPNIPYKTRGNAAVALRLEVTKTQYNTIRELVLDEVEEASKIGEKDTDPAVVFLKEHPTPSVKKLAQRTLCEIVPVREAIGQIKHSDAEAASYGSNLGLVGALAAVGNTIEQDHTFELIAYRRCQNYGKKRRVDKNSVLRMDSLTAPFTFNNYDAESKRVLLTPHGPDPILVGIRGETPEVVRKGFNLLTIREPIERWVIFRTNHATDAHLKASKPGRVKPYSPVVLSGTVTERPRRLVGGHVLFPVQAQQGLFTCAAFEPTGSFRDIITELIPGDRVTAFGGTPGKHGLTINLEKLRIHHLTNWILVRNPSCPNCGKNLKSAGRAKGYRCNRCSTVVPDAKKIHVYRERRLSPGIYLPSTKAHRHLIKPLCRYGHERTWDNKPPLGEWHLP